MPDRLYGFRPKQRPQYQGTDAIANPVDPRIPRSAGAPPVPTSPLASGTDTRINDYSGTSAESDSGDGGATDTTGGASYASPAEAAAYGQAAIGQGYFGTVNDAVAQGRSDVLGGFLSNPNVTGEVKTPGLIGFGLNAAGLTPSHDFTNLDAAQAGLNQSHAQNIGIGIDAFGGRGRDIANTGIGFSSHDPNAPDQFGIEDRVAPDNAAIGFTGNNAQAIAQSQGIAEHSAAPGSATNDAISGIGYSSTGAAPTGSQFSSTGVFSSGDDNSGEQGHGGTQSGAETSHSGGYGGFSDDAASSDTGGGK